MVGVAVVVVVAVGVAVAVVVDEMIDSEVDATFLEDDPFQPRTTLQQEMQVAQERVRGWLRDSLFKSDSGGAYRVAITGQVIDAMWKLVGAEEIKVDDRTNES